jgi:hypothetical protein
MKVLDYGAGKFARNANFIRENNVKCFAYDPYNFNSLNADGWNYNSVSNIVDLSFNNDKKFDIVFSCYVLNVLPKNLEEHIITEVSKLGETVFHIIRNTDIFDSIKSSIKRKDITVYGFYVNEFNGKTEPESMSDDEIMEFCKFGVQTSRGFQRMTYLEEYGFELISKTAGYKVYMSC